MSLQKELSGTHQSSLNWWTKTFHASPDAVDREDTSNGKKEPHPGSCARGRLQSRRPQEPCYRWGRRVFQRQVLTGTTQGSVVSNMATSSTGLHRAQAFVKLQVNNVGNGSGALKDCANEYTRDWVSVRKKLVFKKYFIYLFIFRQRGKGGREGNISVWLPLTLSYWGPGLQPRHVP